MKLRILLLPIVAAVCLPAITYARTPTMCSSQAMPALETSASSSAPATHDHARPTQPQAAAQEDVSAAVASADTASRRVFQLETFVVNGSRVSAKAQDIESRKLRLHKVVDLAEILSDELVEVQMIRKSGYGNEVSLRGFGQENIRVLLEGGLLEGACGSRKDPALSHINMLTVKTLTVVEGPFDVTKPGCLGGYVDVTTRKPEPGFAGEVLGKLGSYGFHSGGFAGSGGTAKIQGLLGYDFSESEQYEDGSGHALWTVREGAAASYNEQGRDAKAFQKHDVWGKLQFTPSKQHTILLEHSYGNARNILTPRVVFDTDEEITNLSKVSWEARELGRLSSKLAVSVYRNAVEHYPFQDFRVVAVPKNNKVESVIAGGAIQNVSPSAFATFSYGIDVYHREWWGDVYNSLTGVKLNDYLIPTVLTTNFGGYVHADRTFAKWTLSLGLRGDRLQQEADEALVFTRAITAENRQVDQLFGGHVIARYVLSADATLFAGAGRSYRTPESTERYIQGGSTFFGNPLLRPTTNTEFDLGVQYGRKQWRTRAKGFCSDLKDYIYQEITTDGYQTYTNIDARIWGGDITAGVDLVHGLSLDGGVSYSRGTKESRPENNDDDDLGQMAPLKGRLALMYRSSGESGNERNGLLGSVEWICSDEARHVDTDAGEKPLAGWGVMNLRAAYQFKSCTMNAGVENVFDRQYTVANSYEWDVVGGSGATPAIVNEPGRFIYVSTGYAW